MIAGGAKSSDLTSLLVDLQLEIESGGRDPGLTTGYTDLDRIVGGMQGGQLIVLAARPSVGKSAFATNMAYRIADRAQVGVFFASLEMQAIEISERLLLIASGIDGNKIKANDLDLDERSRVMDAVNRLSTLPICLDDTDTMSAQRIASAFRRWRRKHECGLLIVDYLQLVDPEDRRVSREQQVATITRDFKRLARRENVPVMVLAQLNRESVKGQLRKPRLPDLRESGAIEQDADKVLFVHRWMPGEKILSTDEQREAEILVRKNRRGKTGDVKLEWDGPTMTFRASV